MFQSVFLFFFVNPLWGGANRGPSRQTLNPVLFPVQIPSPLSPYYLHMEDLWAVKWKIETEIPNI